ncbi:MAG: DUF1800 domain-containing protein [bacterium]|nr:DUF1800 domain-containing protein [bacterium]
MRSRRGRAKEGPSRREILTGGLLLASTLGCKQLDEALLAPLRMPEPATGPFAAPEGAAIDPVRHVLNRLTFGPRPEDYARVRALGHESATAVRAFVDEQLHPERIDDTPGERAVRRLETLRQPAGELFEYQPRLLLDELTRGTLLRAVYSRRQLYEVMVGFWSDHFNVDSSKGDCKWLKAAEDRDVIRRHAMGRFPDLLRASALSPAMLWYLDGRRNRKRAADEVPNENYARELLELHTLGVHGGYTQRDVMEVARCLTGWTVRSEERFGKGRVEFRRHWHDDGPKVVLGRRIPAGGGEQDLDRVLDIVALHPSTASHLATKLCRRFISDEPATATVAEVAETFSGSRGDVRATLRAVFESEAFAASAGSRFKRPFRFLVSALRATGARTDGGRKLRDYLLGMGHAPFQYPTPDGYPDEPSPWHGTLLWRWSLASALAGGRIAGTRIDLDRLRRDLGGGHGFRSHLLGRQPAPEEDAADGTPEVELALLLASPAFQRF